MSFVKSSRLNSIGVRLTAWYLVVFLVSTVLLVAAAMFRIQSSMHARVVETVTAQLTEQRQAFDAAGLAGMEKLAESRKPSRAAQYVRVLDRAGATVFEHREDPKLAFEPENVTVRTSTLEVRTVRASSDGSSWNLGTTALPDGRVLQLAVDDGQNREVIGQLRSGLLAVWIGAIVLGLTGGFYVTRRALRPVAHLASTARAVVASGDLSLRVSERGTGDELDELSGLFNAMLSRNQMLVRGMRDALDNVAHDLRTPLTRLRTGAEVALRDVSSPEQLREALANSIEESEQVLSMLRTLMDISEAETGVMKLDRSEVDLSDVARDVISLYEHVAEERSVRLVTHLSPGVVANCDHNRLHQVLANLVDNAVKYAAVGGQINIRTFREEAQAVISVEDDGPGIGPEDIPHIWERLYRADASRSQRGLGLGLSFVKAVVEAHGGRVDVESRLEHGSRFRVFLPARRDVTE